jgi:hypothetical protein
LKKQKIINLIEWLNWKKKPDKKAKEKKLKIKRIRIDTQICAIKGITLKF